MSAVYFVSDLHLGHRSILRHTADVAQEWTAAGNPGTGPRRGGTTMSEHDMWVVERLLSVKPDKRTLWYILGDVAMDADCLLYLNRVPGRKILVAGNHDLFATEAYLRVFERVMGGFKKYGLWLTHMPLHPDELRDRRNVHGHCHHNTLHGDPRYFNVCIEWLPGGKPVSLDQLRGEWAA